VQVSDNHGWTALMLAAYKGDADSVKALVAAGADLNARNNDGLTAFDYGCTYPNVASDLTAVEAKSDVTTPSAWTGAGMPWSNDAQELAVDPHHAGFERTGKTVTIVTEGKTTISTAWKRQLPDGTVQVLLVNAEEGAVTGTLITQK
jgi:hypothetical protein